MRQPPTFSVIVPAFDAEDRIEAVMRSVLGQTRRDLELIVVDDGSLDRTAALAERLAAGDGRARVLSQANAGTVGARNAGIEASSGSFVSFLDDDDLWLPGYLAAIGDCLEADPAAGLAYSDAWVMAAGTGLVGRRSALERFALPIRRLPAAPPPAAGLRALLRVNFITTCAATVSRRALETVGTLTTTPAHRGCDDWDLWLRISAAGFGLVRVRGRLAVRRLRAGSVGSDELMMTRSSRAVLAAALQRGVGEPRAERVARRHLAALDREIRSHEAAGSPAARWAPSRVLRRLGRKRIVPPPGRDRPPDGELADLLVRLGGSSAGRGSDREGSWAANPDSR